jgi:hypothetical protein
MDQGTLVLTGGGTQTGHLVDDLRQHWPDVSDVRLNSQWSEGCERSDGCVALVLVGETVTKT